MIGTVLADAGYASDANLAAPGPPRLIALGKDRDQCHAAQRDAGHRPTAGRCDTTPSDGPPAATTEGTEQYKRRGATVEPGIGNLKKIIDRFSRRGLDNAPSEIHLAATAFNLLKIHRARARLTRRTAGPARRGSPRDPGPRVPDRTSHFATGSTTSRSAGCCSPRTRSSR